MQFNVGVTYRVLSWEDLLKKGTYEADYCWIEFSGGSYPIFLRTMKPLCGKCISVKQDCDTVSMSIDGEVYTIHPVMCEEVFRAGHTYRIKTVEELQEGYDPPLGGAIYPPNDIGYWFNIEEMDMLCNTFFEAQEDSHTIIVQDFCISPWMCEDVTEQVREQSQNFITTTIEVFDIPDDMLGCAFLVDHDDIQEAMLLYDSSTSALFFKTIDGDEFVCTFAEYKSGNVIIRPMVVSDIIL